MPITNKPIKVKISLKELPHKCERTLLVPEDINLRQLHLLIQDAFGWINAHLFEFTDAKMRDSIRVGVPDEFAMDDWSGIELHAHEVKLKETFFEQLNGKAFWYNYDFGDNWWHQITFLKITQKDIEKFKGTPICIKAEGKCPPEDVGGPSGYGKFLQIIKDKEHREHQKLATWYGLETNEDYDENPESLAEINFLLEDFYESDLWGATTYEYF